MDDQKSARSPAASSRLPGLEELRALAAVLVVGLHAGMPYVNTPMEHVVWPVVDPHPSTTVDCIFWCIEAFIMPLFFILSGWSAASLERKKGIAPFVTDRSRRVLVPLLVAMVCVLPVMLYVWGAGWVVYAGYPVNKLRSLNFDRGIKKDLWGLGHLWYLEYLYVYCLALAAICWLRSRLGGHARLARAPQPLVLLACLVLAGGLILAGDPRIVLGFYQMFLPTPSKLLYYGLYFATGVVLHGSTRLQARLMRHANWFVPAAIAAFCLAWPRIGWRYRSGLSGPDHVILALGLAVFAVSTSLALFGKFLARRNPAHPWVRNVAEASLWIYLMHMPTVGLTHLDLGSWSGSAGVKYFIVWATALAWTLLTYECLVRTTRIGRLLHGDRQLAQRAGLSMTTLRTMLNTSRSRAA